MNAGGLSPAQQSTLQQITNGAAAANAASSDLGVATSLPPLGNDPASQQWRSQTLEVNKQNIASQVAVQLACTTALANLTSVDPDVMDLTAIAGHVSTVGSNLTQLTSGVKMAAALLEDRTLSDLLLEAARKLAAATSKLLTNATGAVTGQGNRQEFVASAQSIATSGSQVLKTLGEPEVPLPAQQELVELAKQVAATMTETISQSKNVAGTGTARAQGRAGSQGHRGALALKGTRAGGKARSGFWRSGVVWPSGGTPARPPARPAAPLPPPPGPDTCFFWSLGFCRQDP